MTPLKQEYVDNCPVEAGFRMRGIEMTRTEVFVDAAFAFAVTMLVISFDAIPTSYDEVVLAIKGIPAFIVAVIQLVWIWYTHNKWSRRYGLDTAMTVTLSTALLIVVLIFIYPMRMMAEGFFFWVSRGYLHLSFDLKSIEELSAMFVFLGIGFVALCLVFVLMYHYAGSLKRELRLNAFESYETRTLDWCHVYYPGSHIAVAVGAVFRFCICFAGWVVPVFAFTAGQEFTAEWVRQITAIHTQIDPGT
jgi:hypothetical protein